MGKFFRHFFCVLCALLLLVCIAFLIPWSVLTEHLADPAYITEAGIQVGVPESTSQAVSQLAGQLTGITDAFAGVAVFVPIVGAVCLLVIVLVNLRHKCAAGAYLGVPAALSGIALFITVRMYKNAFPDVASLQRTMNIDVSSLGELGEKLMAVVKRFIDNIADRIQFSALIALAAGCLLIILAILGAMLTKKRRRG